MAREDWVKEKRVRRVDKEASMQLRWQMRWCYLGKTMSPSLVGKKEMACSQFLRAFTLGSLAFLVVAALARMEMRVA